MSIHDHGLDHELDDIAHHQLAFVAGGLTASSNRIAGLRTAYRQHLSANFHGFTRRSGQRSLT
ncbi:MAG: hypothetical protein Q9P14_10315 [candidate division KSB1 bacterium]|nr:hypothetical protein [candidate division KSB1 bacterium]